MLSEEQLDAIKKMAGDIVVDVKKTQSATEKSADLQPDAQRPQKQKRIAAVTETGGGQNYGRRIADHDGVVTKSNGRRKPGLQGERRRADEKRSSADADIETIYEPESEPLQPEPLTTHCSRQDAQYDENWSLDNLRWSGERAYGDLANVLRIFGRHPEFAGRFRFNKSMGKVMNKGTVMLGWQLDETVAIVQERFIPEVSPETVIRALMICANRNSEKPLE
ncbi:MAG: hypothetical protein HKP25_07165 [Marinicaulis sp.]|nr:hypothetical protein [Marinicaulis sp.]